MRGRVEPVAGEETAEDKVAYSVHVYKCTMIDIRVKATRIEN